MYSYVTAMYLYVCLKLFPVDVYLMKTVWYVMIGQTFFVSFCGETFLLFYYCRTDRGKAGESVNI